MCVCVFSDVEGGAVRVTGAKGFAPSQDYKVKQHRHVFSSFGGFYCLSTAVF